MEDDERITQVPVKVYTREKLKLIGKKGETYDEIINKLIDKYENGKI